MTGITVSAEQLAEAQARVAAAGLGDRVNLIFCDYRKVVGTFDKIVSIEMLEAVGAEHLPTFFDCCSRYLKPGGIAAIQVITLPDARYAAYCSAHSDFIRTYIFPGGHLPSMGAMVAESSRAGLEFDGSRNLGYDYAVTLRLWRERLLANTERVYDMGYDRRFLRMFEFYFAYCEAGFANGLIHDYQIAFKKNPNAPPAEPSVVPPADLTGAAGAVRATAASAGRRPSFTPLDPVTWLCVLLWAGLTAALVVSRTQMFVIPAFLAAFFAARDLGFRGALGLPRHLASSYTALLASALTCGGTTYLLVSALAGCPGLRTAPLGVTLSSLMLEPAVSPALLTTSRAVLGSAAGFAGVRVWELARTDTRFASDEPATAGGRGRWEAASYTVALLCMTAALYHNLWHLALATTQLSEAHAMLMRLRALAMAPYDASGKPRAPSAPAGLWPLIWVTFAALRLAPHAAAAVLFSWRLPHSAAADARAATFLLLVRTGLGFALLSDIRIGWSMLRAHAADAAVATRVQLELEKRKVHSVRGGARTEAEASVEAGCEAAAPRRRAPGPLWVLLAATSVVASAAATTRQEPDTARLIAATSAAYAVGYGLLKLTGAAQPAADTKLPSGKRLAAAVLPEWRSRLLSLANALILSYASRSRFADALGAVDL